VHPQILAIAFPPLDPVAVHLGPIAIRWYGLAYLAGFLIGWLVLRALLRAWNAGVTTDDEILILLGAIVGVVVGGRLGYVLFYDLARYAAHPLEVFAMWDGGMSFHGGLAGIIIAGLILARAIRLPFMTLADAAAVGTPVGLLFGRLANFVNGELWGRVSGVPWAVYFPRAPGALPRHPSQLYEALLEGVVLFVVLWLLARKRRPQGFLFGVMLAGYGVARIAVEFFREPDVQVGFLFGGITMGQLLTVPVLVAGLVIIGWSLRPGRPLDGRDPGAAVEGEVDSGRGGEPKGAPRG
jgi:phosphatidylglycerol:prolipoprotein diacylglycerol transferase